MFFSERKGRKKKKIPFLFCGRFAWLSKLMGYGQVDLVCFFAWTSLGSIPFARRVDGIEKVPPWFVFFSFDRENANQVRRPCNIFRFFCGPS